MVLLKTIYEDWPAIKTILTREVIGTPCGKFNLKGIRSDKKVTKISSKIYEKWGKTAEIKQ